MCSKQYHRDIAKVYQNIFQYRLFYLDIFKKLISKESYDSNRQECKWEKYLKIISEAKKCQCDEEENIVYFFIFVKSH